MKQLICKLIAEAPECHISVDPQSAWYQTQQLYQQAENTEELLRVLMYQYNSAVYPQSEMYKRIDRLHAKALKRKQRRAIASSIAMYRAMGKSANEVSIDHVYHTEIVAALQETTV